MRCKLDLITIGASVIIIWRKCDGNFKYWHIMKPETCMLLYEIDFSMYGDIYTQ